MHSNDMGLERNFDKVSLMVSSRCNLGCEYCWVRPTILSEPEQIPSDILKQTLDSLKKLGVKSIDLFGGEPLLRNDFWDIVYYARSIGLNLNSISTNATLCNRSFFNHLKKLNWRPEIFTTIGSANHMKKIRHCSLRKICQSIKTCYKAGLPIRISIMYENSTDVLELYSIVRQYVRSIQLIPIGDAFTLRPLNYQKFWDQWDQLIKTIQKDKTGIAVNVAGVVLFDGQLNTVFPFGDCVSTRNCIVHPIVYGDGIIQAAGCRKNPQTLSGDVSFMEAYKSLHRCFDDLPSAPLDEKCIGCTHESICRGGPIELRTFENGSYTRNDLFCEYFKRNK